MSSTTADAAPAKRRVTSKRVTKAATETTPEAPAVAIPAETVTTPSVPKKRAAPKKKEAAAPVAAVDVAVVPAEPKEKKPRTPRVQRTFITAFGDLLAEEKERDFSKEEFERWKTQTREAVDQIRFKEWERSKREFYRAIKKLQRKKKRTSRGYNWEATAENHLRRLKEMPKEDFAELDGTWLSNYQFGGSHSAVQLSKDGCPEKGAIPTFTVYLAALHHGYKPLGIVSENGTRSGTEISFTTPVDGKRVYVGVALPFQNKERSKFSVVPKDRVANDA